MIVDDLDLFSMKNVGWSAIALKVNVYQRVTIVNMFGTTDPQTATPKARDADEDGIQEDDGLQREGFPMVKP